MTFTPKSNQIANIREAECIGCKKCIQACPVDAILGTGKLMHTVIADECTGCELCVAPCPVDCIDMLPTATTSITPERLQYFAMRHEAQRIRLQAPEKLVKVAIPHIADERKRYIEAALARVRAKKVISRHT
jgi:electron transport complex protein RnfB